MLTVSPKQLKYVELKGSPPGSLFYEVEDEGTLGLSVNDEQFLTWVELHGPRAFELFRARPDQLEPPKIVGIAFSDLRVTIFAKPSAQLTPSRGMLAIGSDDTYLVVQFSEPRQITRKLLVSLTDYSLKTGTISWSNYAYVDNWHLTANLGSDTPQVIAGFDISIGEWKFSAAQS